MVITGLTRNQFVLTHTRVRIPLSPPISGFVRTEPQGYPCGFYFWRADLLTAATPTKSTRKPIVCGACIALIGTVALAVIWLIIKI